MDLSFATLKTQLAADKKKSVVLVTLLVVLLVVVGQLFLPKSIPEEAVAIVPTAPITAPTTDSNLTRPTPQVVSTNPGTAPTPVAVAGQASRTRLTGRKTVVVDGLSREMVRDPFTTKSWGAYPLSSAATALSAEEKKQQKNKPGILEQLRRQFADYQKSRQVETEKFTMEIDSLQLQSTMTGTRRSAYISGRLVHEGEMIDGFTVVRISDREVILSRNDARGSLRMP